jgi:hypothetical protein
MLVPHGGDRFDWVAMSKSLSEGVFCQCDAHLALVVLQERLEEDLKIRPLRPITHLTVETRGLESRLWRGADELRWGLESTGAHAECTYGATGTLALNARVFGGRP